MVPFEDPSEPFRAGPSVLIRDTNTNHSLLSEADMSKSSNKTDAKRTSRTKQPETEVVDREAIERLVAKKSKRVPGPKLKLDYDEEARSLVIHVDHEDEAAGIARSMLELGITDDRVFDGFLSHMAGLGEHGQVASERATNFALGFVASIEPRDEVEALLAAQMAATHQASMMMARRLNHVTNIPQQDAAERAFNKLARTYTTQMDALKRYRAKAQQTVRVERVTVNEGGQAIVGSVSHEGGGDGKK